MSDERKPLCSDEIIIMHMQRAHNDFNLCDRIRNEYEDLITHGYLRLVKEVELRGNDYDCLLKCDGCGWSIGWHIKDDLPPMIYCPGCGNKVRQ